jgi:hypothetical protein
LALAGSQEWAARNNGDKKVSGKREDVRLKGGDQVGLYVRERGYFVACLLARAIEATNQPPGFSLRWLGYGAFSPPIRLVRPTDPARPILI